MRKVYVGLVGLLFLGVWIANSVAQRLFSDALFGWAESQLAAQLGLKSPSVTTVAYLVVNLGPPVFFTGAVLIAYHLWHAHGHRWRSPRAAVAKASAPIAGSMGDQYPTPRVGKELADMPIQELFFYLDADGLEHATFKEVGQRILDALSLGQLTAYGRQASFANRGYIGHPTLAEIDRSYWKTAVFTYEFFGDDRLQDIHAETRPQSGGLSYRDVRFNSAEVKGLWTKSKASDKIFAMKAVYLILTQSEWARSRAIAPHSMPKLRYESTMSQKEIIKKRLLAVFERDLHDNLRAGKIDTWARVSRHSPLAPIKTEEWSKIKISMDEMDLHNHNNGFCFNFVAPAAYRTTCYENVMFLKSHIFAVYPLRKEPFWIDDDQTQGD